MKCLASVAVAAGAMFFAALHAQADITTERKLKDVAS
jgi:hypothetical protein